MQFLRSICSDEGKKGKEKDAETEFPIVKEEQEQPQDISYGLCLGNVYCGALRNEQCFIYLDGINDADKRRGEKIKNGYIHIYSQPQM